ncbi:uncharacterized protein LOC129234505 [Uloborus diversus]|uniref:uncharacterized protein LOC129234505 n=1 Tax=Uloborus diversus TaxID=327109 RepID=UPI002409905A|nr:uncharacterized protein LOC129234505 [Uloborus diversus]
MRKECLWLLAVLTLTSCTSHKTFQSELGMMPTGQHRSKRRPSEVDDERQMVTIDLSALRPSLPGLVLYNYGDQAPKLVQVDLSTLNPQLQPHVIWPQFDLIDLVDDRPLEFDSMDAIPYLSEDDPLLPPKTPRFSKMKNAETGWSGMNDIADGDIYDFLPDSRRNDELMSLHRNLPLADEVIVPLDWEEEKTSRNSEKRNIFASRGWQPGGQRASEKGRIHYERNINNKGNSDSFNVHYTPFGSTNWMPGKRKHHPGRETESEDNVAEDSTTKSPGTTFVGELGKKNVFISSGWGPGGRQVSMSSLRRPGTRRQKEGKSTSLPVKVSSQESWSVPRQYWSVPHLFGSHWQ